MGRIQQKLCELIEAQGFHVEDLYPAQGYWRIYADVYRWEGLGKANGWSRLPSGIAVSFQSWETMTTCVRQGIVIESDGLNTTFMVYAKSKERNL
jgi:hypothetical protein